MAHPECDFALMEYALNSGFSFHYPHARATFEALMKRNHIFDGKPDLFGPSGTTDNGFLQKHGLGWANSDLSAPMYLVLIVRNSHGKQIPLSNLLREATSEMRGFQYNNEQIAKRLLSIWTNTASYCQMILSKSRDGKNNHWTPQMCLRFTNKNAKKQLLQF